MNKWLTKDIRLHKDSQGEYYASHKHQGCLYESLYFETRSEARSEAVVILRELKEDQED